MNDDLGDVDHLGDVDDLGDVDHLGRRTMISKTPLLMMLSKDGEEDEEDLGGRSFLNILSVLAGRNSLGLAR